jgi:hypothetical protein
MRNENLLKATLLAQEFFGHWEALHDKAAYNNLMRFVNLVGKAIEKEQDNARSQTNDERVEGRPVAQRQQDRPSGQEPEAGGGDRAVGGEESEEG